MRLFTFNDSFAAIFWFSLTHGNMNECDDTKSFVCYDYAYDRLKCLRVCVYCSTYSHPQKCLPRRVKRIYYSCSHTVSHSAPSPPHVWRVKMIQSELRMPSSYFSSLRIRLVRQSVWKFLFVLKRTFLFCILLRALGRRKSLFHLSL